MGGSELPGPGDGGLARAVRSFGEIEAVVHRFVHGGPRYAGAIALDAEAETYLESLVELAPIHQPLALDCVRVLRGLLPEAEVYACFDTAFHRTLPEAAATYALPAKLIAEHGLRRYGFHGLSHAHAARRASELLQRPGLRLVTCHLGSGASLAAVADGVSVDTTMGFTPLEGLVMATRAGSLDPGLVLWLQRFRGFSADELNDVLEHRSGLAGLAGSGDMREVLDKLDAGDPAARLAFDVYVHRLRGHIGAMAAALGGLDAIVFTGGVGENAAAVRAAAVGGLGFLGAELDLELNSRAAPDADVSTPSAAVRTLVVRAREDLEMWREVSALRSRGPDR